MHIQPFNIYLMTTYYVPNTIPGSGDIEMSKINKVFVSLDLVLWTEKNNKF